VRLTGVAGDDDWDMEFIRREISSSLMNLNDSTLQAKKLKNI